MTGIELPGSITQCIRNVHSDDKEAREKAADEIFNRFWSELRNMVMANLDQRVARREAASDIVQEAFASFFLGKCDPEDRHSLRALLMTIVLNKAASAATRNRCQKRNVECEQGSTAEDEFPSLERAAAGDELKQTRPVKRKYRRALEAPRSGDGFQTHTEAVELMAYGATPAQAAMAIEMVAALPEDLQRIAVFELQEYSEEEIGERLGRHPRFVRRQMERIRKRWTRER